MAKGLSIVVLLAGGLSACSTGQTHLAITPAMQAAKSAYIQCLDRVAETLDDGMSDASSVAIGLLPHCEDAFRAVVDAATAGDSLEAKVMDIRALRAGQLPLATSAVIERRAKLRAR